MKHGVSPLKLIGQRFGLLLAVGIVPVLGQAAGERAGAQPATRPQGNRIEITNNHASNVRVKCDAEGRRQNVNSVNIDGRALQGETVFITGRNTRDVVVDECPRDKPKGAGGVNINSVNIR